MFVANPGFFDLVAGLLLAGVLVGIAGRYWRPIRIFLVGLAPLGSAGIIFFFLFEGSGSQCAGAGATFHCWEVSELVGLLDNGFAVAGVSLVTILSLAPIASAWLGRRTPSVTAAYVIPVLILLLFIFVAPWLFIWPAVLAAAIAGPPTRKASLTFSRPTDDTPTYPA
jgi:hypothetical protein